MKTQLKIISKSVNTFRILMMIMLCFTYSVSTAQDLGQSSTEKSQQIVEGVVTNEDGPLPGVNVILKGSNSGTSTDINGKFTFPKTLNNGDVLLFSYLGYETQEVVIDENTTSLKVEMVLDSVTIIESLNTDVPYKSKRN